MHSGSKFQHHLQNKRTIQTLLEKLEENIRFIEKHRSTVDFGPNDTVKAVSDCKSLYASDDGSDCHVVCPTSI